MGQYNRLPHLLTQVVTNPKKAANALSWASEMDRRYDLLSEVGFRDISGYNAAFDRGELPSELREVRREFTRLPYILVVVDELNDLMMVAARDVEDSICRHRPDGPGRRHPPHHRHPAARRSTSSPASSRPTSRPAWPSPSPRSPTAGSSSTSPARSAWSARATCSCSPPQRRPADPGVVGQRGGGAQGRRPLAARPRSWSTSGASRATTRRKVRRDGGRRHTRTTTTC